jgi:hypothetical protein
MVDGPSLSKWGHHPTPTACEFWAYVSVQSETLSSFLQRATIKVTEIYYALYLISFPSITLIDVTLVSSCIQTPKRQVVSGDAVEHVVVQSHCSGTTPSITQFRMRASSICKYLPDCITSTTHFSEEIKAFSTSLSYSALAVSNL